MSSEDIKTRPDMLYYERQCRAQGFAHIAGVDEAGRGPLAGPVVAAAVIFPPDTIIDEVNDSKQLPAAERERLFGVITSSAIAYGVGIVHHDVIDSINILQATYRAMHEAISRLSVPPDHLLIDGNRFLAQGVPFTTIVDGDALSFSIAAASILAKVTRDRMMVDYDAMYPGYGFAKHKGYATREHREAIKQFGICDIHRRTFTVRPQLELEFAEIIVEDERED